MNLFGIDEYLALKSISEISVSPDGLYVAYTTTSSDLTKDETRDTVWMLPTAGGEPLRMTSKDSDSSAPQWSPDGRYLAILSDRKDETSQVWLLDRRGGDARQGNARRFDHPRQPVWSRRQGHLHSR